MSYAGRWLTIGYDAIQSGTYCRAAFAGRADLLPSAFTIRRHQVIDFIQLSGLARFLHR
jgi:hypothetical protein